MSIAIKLALGLPMNKWVEIFRGGERTASNGRKYFFRTEDLDQIVETYSPEKFRAPLILGHKTFGRSDRELAESELSFGVASRLKRTGDRLYALFDRVAPEVREWIEQGRIVDRSASFYPPNSPNSPSPGKWALRHIGLLGKTAPSVKNMTPLNLSENLMFSDSPGIVFNETMNNTSQIFTGIRDALVEIHGIETAESIIPDSLIASFEEEAKLNYQDSSDTKMTEEMQAEIAKLKAELSQQVKARRRDKIASFMERNSNRLTPAMLGDVEIEFGEETVTENLQTFAQGLSESQLAYFEKFVELIPQQIEFGELTADNSLKSRTKQFGDSPSAKLLGAIAAYQSEHPEMSFEQVKNLPEFSEQVNHVYGAF